MAIKALLLDQYIASFIPIDNGITRIEVSVPQERFSETETPRSDRTA
jgi:hypothetical protein